MRASERGYATPSLLALVVLALAWTTLIWLWRPSADELVIDDAYYYFETARNAALGYGFTFDRIHPTDGYHPLWMWALVPLTRVCGQTLDSFVRVVLTLQVGLVLGGTWGFLRSVGEDLRGWRMVCLVGLFASPYVMAVLVNGLEAALEYALLLIACAVVVSSSNDSRRALGAGELVFLGGILGMLTLTRLTAVAFAVPALAWSTWRVRSRPWVCAAAVGVYVVSVGAFIVCHHAAFGHWLPINAAIKAGADGGPLLRRLRCLLLSLGPSVAVFGVLCLPQRRAIDRPYRLALVLLFVWCATQSALDALLRGRVIPETWYMVPQVTFLVLALCASRSPGLPVVWRWGAVAVLVGTGAVGWRKQLSPRSYAANAAARRQGEWLAAHTSEDAIGAGWWGITGAHSRRRFIDLTGLVNTWSFKERYLEADRLGDYLDTESVDYLAHAFDLATLNEQATALAARPWSAWSVVYVDCQPAVPVDHTVIWLLLSRRDAGPSLRQLLETRGRHACLGS